MNVKRERVFTFHAGPKDIAVLVVCWVLAIPVLGIIATHDIAYGMLVGFMSSAYYIAACCMYFNPDKYKQRQEDAVEDDEIADESEDYGGFRDWMLTILSAMFALVLGGWMIEKADVLVIPTNGHDAREMFTFSDMDHAETAGWILYSAGWLLLWWRFWPLVKRGYRRLRGRR